MSKQKSEQKANKVDILGGISISFFFQPSATGMMLTDLPASLQLNIMQRLSDGRDLVSLGQVCPELGLLTEDRLLWKKLCQYHFTDRQAWRNPFPSARFLLVVMVVVVAVL